MGRLKEALQYRPSRSKFNVAESKWNKSLLFNTLFKYNILYYSSINLLYENTPSRRTYWMVAYLEGPRGATLFGVQQIFVSILYKL